MTFSDLCGASTRSVYIQSALKICPSSMRNIFLIALVFVLNHTAVVWLRIERLSDYAGIYIIRRSNKS